MSKIDEVQSTVKNTPGLGKKMAKYGAIGAVVAIPCRSSVRCWVRWSARASPTPAATRSEDAFDHLCVARSAAMKTAR